MIVPAEHIRSKSAQRSIHVGRTVQGQFLRPTYLLKVCLRATQVGLVSVTVPRGSGVGWHIDLIEIDFRLSDGFLVIVWIDQRVEIARKALSLLHQYVMDERIHFIIRVLHGGSPSLFAPGRRLVWLAASRMDGTHMIADVSEGMDDAARIFLAESTKHAIRAA